MFWRLLCWRLMKYFTQKWKIMINKITPNKEKAAASITWRPIPSDSSPSLSLDPMLDWFQCNLRYTEIWFWLIYFVSKEYIGCFKWKLLVGLVCGKEDWNTKIKLKPFIWILILSPSMLLTLGDKRVSRVCGVIDPWAQL